MSKFDEYLASREGVRIDLDGAFGAQCVDLADDYAQFITGVPWPQSIGAVGMADELWRTAPDQYWRKIDNVAGSTFPPGSLVVYSWGHVALVIHDDGASGGTLLEQDGAAEDAAPGTQYAHRKWRSWAGAYGVLVPRALDAEQAAQDQAQLQATDAVAALQAEGFEHAQELINAAGAAGLPLGIAVALISKESHGANVYGHDAGGAFYGAGEVTRANFQQFLAQVRAGATSNGVGPAQITWPGFFDQAEAQGIDLSDPEQNMLFGFRLVAGYLGGDYSYASLVNAGTRYNGASAYGYDFAARCSTYTAKLSGASAGAQPVAPSAPAPSSSTYTVQPGDTMGGIASAFGTTVEALAAINRIANPDMIYAGQVLQINGSAAQTGGGGTYVVREGDTLGAIASEHETTVDTIAGANGINNPDLIYPGQVLTIQSSQTTYTVVDGDTLSGIADQHGTSVESIVAANGISDPDLIYPGQVLTII